jgi:ABC-type uncharacterized transport system ATPase subunit
MHLFYYFVHPLPNSEKYGDGCKKAQRCIILQIILNRHYMKSVLRIEELPKNMQQKISFITSTM